CTDVLRIVLATHALESDGIWRTVLPDWFVAACSKEGNLGVANDAPGAPWRLEAWLSWFVNPEFELNRPWHWWNSEVLDPETLRIEIEADGIPFESEALRWLIAASGAAELREEP
ncbi:MAG: hypothetical protein ACREB0_13905, partial [Sphingopyxis sp.]